LRLFIIDTIVLFYTKLLLMRRKGIDNFLLNNNFV
jgi:hypothetical protein